MALFDVKAQIFRQAHIQKIIFWNLNISFLSHNKHCLCHQAMTKINWKRSQPQCLSTAEEQISESSFSRKETTLLVKGCWESTNKSLFLLLDVTVRKSTLLNTYQYCIHHSTYNVIHVHTYVIIRKMKSFEWMHENSLANVLIQKEYV